MYQVQIELHENGTVSALPPEHGCGGTRTGRLEMTSSCLVRQLTAGQTMPSTARRSFIADRGRGDVRADQWGRLVGISPCHVTQRGVPTAPAPTAIPPLERLSISTWS